MSEKTKVIGATVGTPLSLSKIKEKFSPYIRQQGYEEETGYIYNLEIGKEYKLVCEPLVGDPSDFEKAYISCYIPEEGEVIGFSFSSSQTDTLTLKILGIEGTIISYECNGEMKTYDVSYNFADTKPSYTLGGCTLREWDGEFFVRNPDGITGGADGKDGVGISEIRCTSATSGAYRIEFTDGSYFDFIVPKGKDGTDGKNGIDGKTPYIQDGYWYIDGVNTNVKAEGKDGKDGEKGDKGDQGLQGIQGIQGERGEKGEKGDKGEDGADGKDGINGVDGKDYVLTEADRVKIVSDVEKAINLPDYVKTEAKRVADLVKAKQTLGSLTFTAMSDFHVEVDTQITYGVANNEKSCRDAGFGLAELQKHCNLDFTAMLGDYTWMDNSETTTQVKKDLSFVKEKMRNGTIGIPNIWCTGNHDINYGTNSDRRMTEDELYAYIVSNNKGTIQDSSNIERNYGYIDFENQKIRCIYLNTVDALDYPDNTDGTADDASEVTAIQAQWLVDVGLNLSGKTNAKDWGIITLSHHCVCTFMPITAILTAYKDGASGSVDVTTNGVTTTVSYNFTDENRGEIICAVHGHDHNFTYRKISTERWDKVTEENAWLWSICVPNVDTTRNNEKATNTDMAYAKAFGEFDANGNPVYYPKTQDTATSTSFCVIVIDRKNKKVHAIHYGAGIDREIYYGEEIVNSYPITYALTKCIGASSNANSIDNGGTVTLTFTANSGCSLPDMVGVVGAKHTWDKSTGTLVLSEPTSNVTVNITAVSAYTNVIDTVGTENGVRLRGTGATQTGYEGFVSGYFEAFKNDIVRVYMPNGLTSSIPSAGNAVAVCDSSKTIIGSSAFTLATTANFLKITDNGYSFKIANADANYVRVAGGPKDGHTDWVVTVNETIPQAPELD